MGWGTGGWERGWRVGGVMAGAWGVQKCVNDMGGWWKEEETGCMSNRVRRRGKE